MVKKQGELLSEVKDNVSVDTARIPEIFVTPFSFVCVCINWLAYHLLAFPQACQPLAYFLRSSKTAPKKICSAIKEQLPS